MDVQATVSVIIPVYNAAEYIEANILNLSNQNYKDFEIILIDDGSQDNSLEILQKFEQQANVTVLHQFNQGPGAARNLGIKNANGRYICFLDADDILAPTSIGQRVELLEQYPDVDFVFTDITRVDKADEPGYAFNASQEFLAKFIPAIEHADENNFIFNQEYIYYALKNFPFIWTSAVMMRRSITAKIGMFNPYWRGSEDIEYWYRIMQEFKLAYINQPLTVWRHDRSGLTKTGNYRFFDDTLLVYDNLRQHFGKASRLYPLITKRLASFAFYGGYEAMEATHLPQARKFFLQACQIMPFKLKNWLYLMFSLLPVKMFSMLRSFKQSMLRV